MTESRDFPFHHRLRVRWTEVDMQGVVFFGHYVTYFDLAMAEYFRAMGRPYPDGLVASGGDLFVKKVDCEYFGSARYDDLLDIGVRTARLGRSSLTLGVAVTRDGETLAAGEVVYVHADPESRQSVPLPEDLRASIEAVDAG